MEIAFREQISEIWNCLKEQPILIIIFIFIILLSFLIYQNLFMNSYYEKLDVMKKYNIYPKLCETKNNKTETETVGCGILDFLDIEGRKIKIKLDIYISLLLGLAISPILLLRRRTSEVGVFKLSIIIFVLYVILSFVYLVLYTIEYGPIALF